MKSDQDECLIITIMLHLGSASFIIFTYFLNNHLKLQPHFPKPIKDPNEAKVTPRPKKKGAKGQWLTAMTPYRKTEKSIPPRLRCPCLGLRWGD